MKISQIAIAAALSLTALASQAALVAGSYTCSLTDVVPGATACSGAWQGNDVAPEANLADTLAELANLSAGTWTYIGKSDDAGSGPFTSNPGGTSGTLTLDAPYSGTFAVSLKSSNEFSLYVWEDVMNVSSFTFDLGDTNGLSHASLFTSDRVIPGPIPEPSTYALMLAGLGAVGLVARRRRAPK